MGRSLWNLLFSWRASAAESRRLGRYHIVRIVHDGEKACVYEARQPGSEESVAIKAYKSLYNRTARRMRKRYNLRTEGEIGRLLAPADAPEDFPIVRTLGEGWEFGDRAKCYYIVMEYVEGLNLKHLIGCGDKWLRGHRLQVAVTAARALEIIHQHDLVHRDVCTDNLIVRKDGRVKLIDLGFVVPGGISFEEKSGTPSYMAPEQFEGKPLTAATDVYSFGVVLYELFTGTLPFTSQYSTKDSMMVARRTADLRFKHLREAPTPPRELIPEMPERLNEIILHCLTKLPERRYPGMQRLSVELAGLDQPSAGVRDGAPA